MKTRQKVGEEEAYLFHVPLNMITLYTVRSHQDFQEIYKVQAAAIITARLQVKFLPTPTKRQANTNITDE